MSIKEIFDEIANESSTNKKMEILAKYQDNETLKRVLYLAESKRVKFYLKQIPEYIGFESNNYTLEEGLDALQAILDRTVRGNDAIDHLRNILESVSGNDAYIIQRIIEKDPKIGMGTTNINKIFGKNFIEKTPYMGAKAYDEKLAREIIASPQGAVSQIKMDGRYCNALIDGGMIRLESRGGEPSYLQGAKFIEELKDFEESIVLNGELTMDDVSRYESNGIIASCISIGKKRTEGQDITKELEKFQKKHTLTYQEALDRIVFTVWDCITPDEYADNMSSIPYLNRFGNLNQMLEKYQPTMIRKIESKVVYSYKEAVEEFQKALNAGEEGTILKALDGTWKDGKPKWQIKMKLEMDLDMEIIGFNYGKEGTKNENVISSLTVQSKDGIVKTRPAGMKEDDMKYVTENMDALLGKIVKVKCSGLSEDRDGDKALLHPVFIEIRDDKDVADSYEEMLAIENMKKGLS